MTGKDRRGTNSKSEAEIALSSSDDADIDGREIRDTQDFSSSTQQSPQGTVREEAGPTTLGRYEIRGQLGQGSFGAVFYGFDPKLNRQVAIKVPHIRDDVDDHEDAFLQEAQRLAQLRHQGIVAVYDVGVEDGRCYIVSEYLEQ